jgi:hypothetical protein
MKKNKLSYLGVTFAVVFALTGCSAMQPFRDEVRVERSSFFLARSYTQDGKVLSISDLYDQLEKNEDAAEYASAGHLWYYGAIVTGGIGGYFVGYNLANRAETSEKQTGLTLGGGFLLVSLFSAFMADRDLNRAVDTYNQKLPATPATTSWRMVPTFSVAKDRGNLAPIFGLALSY